MSKIIATDNFKTKNWQVEFEDLAATFADLMIGFTDQAPVIQFDNLKFSFKLTENGKTVSGKSYPPAGVKYVQTDQPYLAVERLKLKPETDYVLDLWAENAGEQFEKQFEFSTPRPSQPFDSWTWNSEDKVWQAPTPRPNDGKSYTWDENSRSWIEVTEE